MIRMLKSFHHLKLNQNTSHKSFQRYHPGFFMADAMQILRIPSFLGSILKPEAVGSRFKTDHLDSFHISGQK